MCEQEKRKETREERRRRTEGFEIETVRQDRQEMVDGQCGPISKEESLQALMRRFRR